jgi:hypothetical protein
MILNKEEALELIRYVEELRRKENALIDELEMTGNDDLVDEIRDINEDICLIERDIWFFENSEYEEEEYEDEDYEYREDGGLW